MSNAAAVSKTRISPTCSSAAAPQARQDEQREGQLRRGKRREEAEQAAPLDYEWMMADVQPRAIGAVMLSLGNVGPRGLGTVTLRVQRGPGRRALGARRATIFSIVLLEATTICVVGALAGLLGGHLVVAAANGALYRASGFVIPAFHIQPLEWYILYVAVALGAVSGIGPAWGAYRTDVAKNLAPSS